MFFLFQFGLNLPLFSVDLLPNYGLLPLIVYYILRSYGPYYVIIKGPSLRWTWWVSRKESFARAPSRACRERVGERVSKRRAWGWSFSSEKNDCGSGVGTVMALLLSERRSRGKTSVHLKSEEPTWYAFMFLVRKSSLHSLFLISTINHQLAAV